MKFWNWTNKTETAERSLSIEGPIAEESWFSDDVTPALFRSELFAESGPVTVYINSPGGDCVAASQIYTMLMEYPHDVTVKVDGMAASAASVIAMAGTDVQMAPTALLMIHNPMTVAWGNESELTAAIDMLAEVKESIVNAYEIKTGLDREQISEMMDAETWMNAKKALSLGFIDKIIGDDDQGASAYSFSTKATDSALQRKLVACYKAKKTTPEPKATGTPAAELMARLNKLDH